MLRFIRILAHTPDEENRAWLSCFTCPACPAAGAP